MEIQVKKFFLHMNTTSETENHPWLFCRSAGTNRAGNSKHALLQNAHCLILYITQTGIQRQTAVKYAFRSGSWKKRAFFAGPKKKAPRGDQELFLVYQERAQIESGRSLCPDGFGAAWNLSP